MSFSDSVAATDEGLPLIFGVPHSLLAEVASQAARDVAAAHVRAGRLTPAQAEGLIESTASALDVRTDDLLP